jgi:hypothetical protein
MLFFVPAMLMPTAAWSLALIGPAIFCLVLPMGTVGAALTVIFPNQVRAQVSALYLFILNLGGLTLGPLLPEYPPITFRTEHAGPLIAPTMARRASMRHYLATSGSLAYY